MGKRQVRITGKDLHSRGIELVSSRIHIILTDNSVFYGTAIKIDDKGVYLQDQRKTTHLLPLTTITEIIIDKEAPF
jgi:hypothetical protein